MYSLTARVPTPNGAKYVMQLCKHWGHKLEVWQEGNEGRVTFPTGQATMRAEAEMLLVTVSAAGGEEAERLAQVVARHLDRFAFREAPLPFGWSPGAEAG